MANFQSDPKDNKPMDPRKEDQPTLRRAGATHNWEGLIDRMLGGAVQKKEWQDLKGQGQRMNLDAPPGVPADQILGNKIMRDNEVAPAWIENRKALLKRIEIWRRELRARAQILGATEIRNERQLALLSQEITDLNREIRDANIAIPIARLELVNLNLVEEMQEVQDLVEGKKQPYSVNRV